MKKLTKKQKITIVTVLGIAVIAFGGTYAYGQSQSSKKLEEAKQELTVSTNKLFELDEQVVALLDSKDSNYLAKDVTEKQITDLKEKIKNQESLKGTENLPKDDYDKFKKEAKTVNQDIQKVEKAYKTQTTINSLFISTGKTEELGNNIVKQTDRKEAMNGTDVQKDLPIVADLKKETVEQAKKDYFNDKSTDSYHKVVNELITNAENQVNQLEKAKAEVAKVYKDGKVVSTDTKAYDTAKAETDKVKNEQAKKDLSDQLEKVKADIDKKAKEEADKNNQSASANGTAQANEASQANASGTSNGNTETGSNATASNNNGSGSGYTDNGYTPSAGGQGGNTGGNGGGYTPPVDNGGGSTGGGATNNPPSNGGGGNSNGNGNVIDGNDVQGSSPNNNNGDDIWGGW